jgi:hypothetical protein
MRKMLLLVLLAAAGYVSLRTLSPVRAAARISTVGEVTPGMSMADVLDGLNGDYSVKSEEVAESMRHYVITGGSDRRYDYEIFAINGKVASVWIDDAKAYSGDASVVGTELFDALYAAGQPRHDAVGDAMGVRSLQVSAQLQKPASDSSTRTVIFELPGQDFRLSFLNAADGTPSLLVQRVKSLDEKGYGKLLGAGQTK